MSPLELSKIDVWDNQTQLIVRQRQLYRRTYVPAWMSKQTQQESDPHRRFHLEFTDFTKWVMVDDLSNHERMF